MERESRQLKQQSSTLGVPITLLRQVYSNKQPEKVISIQISNEGHGGLTGDFELPPFEAYYKIARNKSPSKIVGVVCYNERKESFSSMSGGDEMMINIACTVSIVDGLPDVALYIQPRLVLQNMMSINIFARTSSSYVYKNGSTAQLDSSNKCTIQRMEPFETVEVYSSLKSLRFSFKCADIPVGDVKTGWNKPRLNEFSLSASSKLEEKTECYFPLVDENGNFSRIDGGSCFFISETIDDCVDEENHHTAPALPPLRKITINTENLGIDHTGDFLFESCTPNSHPFTLSTFSRQQRRITLLPTSNKLIRIIQLSTERRSMAFNIEEIPFANGGTDSTSIKWRDGTESGFYAYKKISFVNNLNVENHMHNQLEIHVIPAIILFNGGFHTIRVLYAQGKSCTIGKGQMAPVSQTWGESGLSLLIEFTDFDCATSPLKISKTGLLVSVVNSKESGNPVGSVAIQTMIGRQDSRYVIKIGPVKHGNVTSQEDSNASSSSLFVNDLLRFRIRWSQMEVTFLDTSIANGNDGSEVEYEISESSNRFVQKKSTSYSKVAHIILKRFTVDYQKVFKDHVESTSLVKRSQARSQFAVIIHSLLLTDCTESKGGKTVLASVSKATNFFELCIRTRDIGDGIGVSNIDLLEIKLANNGHHSDQIILNTSEDFLWKILDILSRTKEASMIYEALDTRIEWNDDTQTFDVEPIELAIKPTEVVDDHGNYSTPRSDALYVVKKASVLPTSFLVSFKRQPQTSRYKKALNVRSAKIVDYFTKKLNFTVDSAKLKFSGFQVHNVKGPPERILDLFKAFYSSQMKSKIFTLLTATSIDEWKQLAGRDDGERGYLEGDLLRTAGNLTGKSAGFLVKKVGQGIGYGLTTGTAEVGNGIQNMTEAIGVGAVGAGVNSVISGIGGGVGSTVEGGKY